MTMPTALEPLGAILDGLPDNVRGEIIDGRLTVTARPTFQHQIMVSRLVAQLSGAEGGRFVAVSEPDPYPVGMKIDRST
jgi:hypothetical protein